MDSQSYKQAVTDMYTAMQEAFAANEKLQRLTNIVWDWDRMAPLPPSPLSEPEDTEITGELDNVNLCTHGHAHAGLEPAPRHVALVPRVHPDGRKVVCHAGEVPCECPEKFDDAGACVHECCICLNALTLKDSEGLCWLCEDYLETVPTDYPDDMGEATTHGAIYPLILRIQANNCREAAYDEDDAVEMRHSLQEAKRLDALASDLLKSSGSFKPWWFNRWDYWMQPGSTHQIPDWAESVTAECTVCLNPLMLHEAEGTCIWCKEELQTVPIDYPKQSAEAMTNGAFHPLVLRVRADKFRYHAHSSKSAAEKAEFLADAERIDTRASELLHKNAASTFKPWWHTRWNYWCKPGSMHMAPAWAGSLTTPVAAPVAEPLPKPDYNHTFWPSPRPKLFAKACAPEMKSMKHQDALVFLATRAKITVDELLKMNPGTYIQRHMGNKTPQCWSRNMW